MKKIAFFIPDLSGGGAERTLVNLLKEWEDPDYGLDLVLVKARGVYLKEIPSRVHLTDLGKERVILAALPLLRYLRKNKPDILISHLSHLNILCLLIKKIFSIGTPLVLVEQSVLSPGRAKGKERIVRWLTKKLYPSAGTIVAVSENTARDLEDRLGLKKGKIRTIYNPIVSRELFVKAAIPVSHPWLDNKDRPVFISVGRLTPQKGFLTLLKAFALVNEQRPARLMILGEGELRSELQENIATLGLGQDVWMPGFKENPYAYMARADAFVLSSGWEGLSSVLVEAMACGCPVIATRSPGGQDEILDNGKYGILTPADDPLALADGMIRALRLSAGKEERIQRAAYYSVEKAAKAYAGLCAEILSDNKPRREIKAHQNGKLPLLHIITDLNTGGAEIMLCNLLSGISREKWAPVVVSLRGDHTQTGLSTLSGRLEEAGIPVHFVGMKPGKLPSPGKIWNLVRLVRRLNPRLIHGWMYHGNLAAQFVNCFVFPKPPLIWSIHYSLDEWKGEKKMTKKMIGLGAGLSRRPAKIIYVSQVSCTQHRSIGYDDKRACVIPNGVDPAFFVPSGEARRAVRSELGLGQADFVIGLLARYHPMKDHENFLRAAALLSARYPDVHFVLAGTNVDHRNQVLNDLIRQGGISDRVHLMGERRDSHRILAAMDLFSLSSSNAEAFPMVLLEAMSCGLPCVTTQVGDAPQIVGDTGLVAPPRDPIALADAWESLIRDGAEKRRALGEAARERIINNYSLSWVVSTYEKLYQDIIKSNQDATAGNPGKTMI